MSTDFDHKKEALNQRLDRRTAPSVQNWKTPQKRMRKRLKEHVAVEVGWGRLIFGQTFDDQSKLAETIMAERPGFRDIAVYIRDPHVVLSQAPQELFLDPSHTYRLWFDRYRTSSRRPRGFTIRKIQQEKDANELNRIYKLRHMVPADPEFVWSRRKSRLLTYLVAQSTDTGDIIGTVMGVDHKIAFNDPENGSSLWCLAVDPLCTHPGVGEALVRHLAEYFQARSRSYMDLSVLYDNEQAISLYEKLGFERVPVFCIKRKNPINEKLFISAPPETTSLNPYAEIIVNEARRRGISVEILDEEAGYFSLTFGGRSVVCRESLTELTSAIAMDRCKDKRVTCRLFRKAGLRVPAQKTAGGTRENLTFLQNYGRIVVKPRDAEQGTGISVDVRTEDELEDALTAARKVHSDVILEEFVRGDDLRVVVIGYKVVAAAIRKPAQVTGTGQDTVLKLIEKQDRRRAAATGGESRIPMDEETRRCVGLSGYDMEDVLPAGKTISVRRTANLHTGGTIHDVTEQLSPSLRDKAEKAAQALKIPVVGVDFLVKDVKKDEYVIIEANERPGLANHEPQPVVERFMDLLFPYSEIESLKEPEAHT